MKIGLTSFAYRWAFRSGMVIDDFLHEAAGLGAEVVQLCENSGVDRLDEEGINELTKLAGRLNLALEYGSSGADRAQMEAGIRRTARLGGTLYRCVVDSDGLPPETVSANLKAALPVLKDCGVMLCAENHFRFSPQILRRIVSAVADPAVAICLDPLNSIAQLIGPEETVRELIDLARTAHVKDVVIKRSLTGFALSGVPLGEGQLDLAGYLDAVAPRAESLLLESWMDPVDGEQGRRTRQQEAIWADNGLRLVRKLTNRSSQ